MERTRTPFEEQLETELVKHGYCFDEIIYLREKNAINDEQYPVRRSIAHLDSVARLEYQIYIYKQNQDYINTIPRNELELLLSRALKNDNSEYLLFEDATLYPTIASGSCKQTAFRSYPIIYASAAPLLFEFSEEGRCSYNARKMTWKFFNALNELRKGLPLTFKERPPTERHTLT